MANRRTDTKHQADDPGAVGYHVLAARREIKLCNDVYGGTFAMRDAKTEHLPQHPKEEDDAYDDRKERATLFNAFKRTVRGTTGLAFRKDPTLGDDIHERIVPLLDNIDLAGSDLSTYAKAHFRGKIKLGQNLILVDWRGPDGAEVRGDENEGGARPYWTMIAKDQVLRWRTANEDGETVLRTFAYQETEVVSDGAFTDKLVVRVRQYDLEGEGEKRVVRYRSWVRDHDRDNGQWEPEADRFLGKRMTRIPLVVDSSDADGYLMSEPPLLDLAHLTKKHWWKSSEYDQALGIAGIPIFTVVGDVPSSKIQTFTVGAAIGLLLPEGSSADYTETSGNALGAMRENIQDIEQQMASLGLSLLVRRDSRPQTAEAERLNRTEQDSELADAVKGTQNALGEALKLTALWLGLDEVEGGSIGLSTDFEMKPIDAQTIQQFRELWINQGISWETLVEILLQGEVLPESVTIESERERIAEERGALLDAEQATMFGNQPGPEPEPEPEEEEDPPEPVADAA